MRSLSGRGFLCGEWGVIHMTCLQEISELRAELAQSRMHSGQLVEVDPLVA